MPGAGAGTTSHFTPLNQGVAVGMPQAFTEVSRFVQFRPWSLEIEGEMCETLGKPPRNAATPDPAPGLAGCWPAVAAVGERAKKNAANLAIRGVFDVLVGVRGFEPLRIVPISK
jgi:hypothetical protein